MGNQEYLFVFFEKTGVDLEQIFLSGNPLPNHTIRAFGHWLSNHKVIHGDEKKKISAVYYNEIVSCCQQASTWFIEQFGNVSGKSALERKMNAYLAVEAEKRSWKQIKKKVKGKKVAGDLSDEEIESIESFLFPTNRIKSGTAVNVAHRNYLIWRLFLEFGLRRGELLATRLMDCPNRLHNYLRIVKLDERGSDYFDPRGKFAPRPNPNNS